MERFENLQHYSAITKEFKKKYDRLVTCNFYMASDIERLTTEKRLYFEIRNNTLLIFRDEGNYWDMNLISAADTQTSPLNLDKNCTFTLHSRDNTATDKEQKIRSIVEGLGFQQQCRYRYFEIDPTENANEIKNNLTALSHKLSERGFMITSYCESFKTEICNMWHDSFGASAIEYDDINSGIENAVLVINSSNDLCGVYMPKKVGNAYSMWHLSVKQQFRNMGLARLLALTLLNDAVDLGYKKVFNWISLDNTPSLNLHRSLGMRDMHNIADKYILVQQCMRN